MQISRKLTHAVVALACIGMIVPQAAFAAPKASASKTTATQTVKARDVALNEAGDLTGAVLNAKAQDVDGAKVALTRKGQVVAQAITGKDGRFTMPQVKSGTYEIVVGDKMAPIRVWRTEAAPANAARKLSLASEGVIRAQCDGEECSESYCESDCCCMVAAGALVVLAVVGVIWVSKPHKCCPPVSP